MKVSFGKLQSLIIRTREVQALLVGEKAYEAGVADLSIGLPVHSFKKSENVEKYGSLKPFYFILLFLE